MAARPPKKGSKADLEAKAARAAKKEAKGKGSSGDLAGSVFKVDELGGALPADDGGRVATGTLVSEVRARDIKINAFSLALHGKVLVEDTTIELNHGSRYAVIGRNGCGKSSLLQYLAAR